MTNTTLLPFQPAAMTPAQLAAVSYLARYTGHTHTLYAYRCAAGSHGPKTTTLTR
jgi:integrase/recombinase XerD